MQSYLDEMIRAFQLTPPRESHRFAPTNDVIEAIIQANVTPSERREEKRQMALLLREATGIHHPWGALTGVRPTTLMKEWSKTQHEDEASLVQALAAYYGIAAHQGRLGLKTARKEEAVDARMKPQGHLFYIGIPFCPTRCLYCSFVPADGIAASHELQAKYVDRLLHEVKALWRKPEAIYIGGGTPTALYPDLFSFLIEELESLPGWTDVPEITLEAGRVDSLTPEILEIIANAHFTSICLNPQSLQSEVLMAVGRPGTPEQLLEVYNVLRTMNLKIHMDLIFGLPKETSATFLNGVDQLIALDPAAITIHPLAKKKGADLYEITSDLTADTLAEAQGHLERAGYEPYYLYRHKYALGGLENCSFAKPGMESLYNVGMMNDRHPVLACGVCAMSKELKGGRIIRHPNRRTLHSYLDLSLDDLPSKGQYAVLQSLES